MQQPPPPVYRFIDLWKSTAPLIFYCFRQIICIKPGVNDWFEIHEKPVSPIASVVFTLSNLDIVDKLQCLTVTDSVSCKLKTLKQI